jgi:DNA modification methylase
MSERVEIVNGDSLLVLQLLDDNSVDAIVTDPPYGLAFMGKKWDYDVPSEELWRQCFRVLKAGGHLLCFAGTRTQHRMAVRIEDAGFEIRDMIAWVYGSGFPKSLDVSKAIDKMDAAQEQQARRYRFTEWVRSTGITSKQIDEATQTNMGGHYTTAASQPAIMTREHLEACRHLLGDIPEWVEREADIRSVESKNFAEREVVGQKIINGEEGTAGGYKNGIASIQGADISINRSIDITIAATPEAKQWEGWGTALKPALEPITVARKPLIGTVAENVMEWGTGGLNIDGCRVGTSGARFNGRNVDSDIYGKYGTSKPKEVYDYGRWPANLIHDGSEEVVGLFPDTKSGKMGPWNNRTTNGSPNGIYGKFDEEHPLSETYGDSGSAARFFYCAKASKRDRDEGNNHPTVKPTDLMRYLCRLVTPPDGTVLDPFMGSGSTGKAAVLEGFRFIGIEREEEYCEIAKARIKHAQQ